MFSLAVLSKLQKDTTNLLHLLQTEKCGGLFCIKQISPLLIMVNGIKLNMHLTFLGKVCKESLYGYQ